MAKVSVDNATLYIRTNGCSYRDVDNILGRVFREIVLLTGSQDNESCRYLLNFCEEKERCYVRVLFRDDFNYLVGNNPDGTPHMVPKVAEKKSAPVLPAAVKSTKKFDWADDLEEEETQKSKKFNWADDSDEEITNNWVGEKTIMVREPFVFVPGYVFLHDEKDCLMWDNFVKPGEIAIMRAEQADVFNWLDGSKLILKVTPVIESCTKMHIKRLLSYYSTSSDKSFPQVEEIKNSGDVKYIVSFDPKTKDGIFAYPMIQKSKARIDNKDVVFTIEYAKKPGSRNYKKK